MRSPIGSIELYAMPLQAGIVEKFDQRGTVVGSVAAKIEPTGQEELHKPAESSVLFHQRLIEPTEFVVLAICIVVALLGTADLISGQKHRRADRQHIEEQKVLHLAISESLNFCDGSWPFRAAIPTVVVVGAVPVLFAIGLVVLVVVRHKII